MTRRSLRRIFLVAAIGSAASVVFDVNGHQARAASVINLNTGGAGGSTYTLGYITNTTITNDAQVAVAAAALTANPGFSVAGLIPANIPTATTNSYGYVPPASGTGWIGPNSAGTASGTVLDRAAFFVPGFNGPFSAPQGFYYYTTTFTLTPATGSYSITDGLWASDNQGVAIFINGLAVPGVTNNEFITYSSFSIPSADFNSSGAGLNTLSFVIWNENYLDGPHPTPSALSIRATIKDPPSVPEPTAIAVVVSGLPLIGLFWAARRRRRAASV